MSEGVAKFAHTFPEGDIVEGTHADGSGEFFEGGIIKFEDELDINLRAAGLEAGGVVLFQVEAG